MPIARVQDLSLAYDSLGDADAPALLLIAGLGTQMIRWTESFCTALAGHGLRVIRFDNRDSGLSTHSDAPAPDFAAMMAGRPITLPYTLTDMAGDAIGLLDALGIARAHIVGRSMGGMIGQIMASLWPQRVLSLTSIMASSGHPTLPPPAPEVMAMLMAPTPDLRRDEADFLAHRLAFARKIASPTLPFDEAEHRALTLAELRRGWQPGATARQMAAIAMDGDRSARLATITAPALVVHGSADPLFPLPHGEDTASAIPHARLLTIEGMGHDLPAPFHAIVIEAIAQICRQTR